MVPFPRGWPNMSSAVLRAASRPSVLARPAACRLAVIWIDWYPYHVARFRGLVAHPELADRVAGIELVGGVGVHAGLKFREALPPELPIRTLHPEGDWTTIRKSALSAELWRALTRVDPAAVLVPGYYTLPGLTAALWARVHGRPSILMSESAEDDHARSPLRERLKSLLLRTFFDGAVVGGSVHRRYLKRLGFPLHNVAGCYDVVDNDGIAQAVAAVRVAQPAAPDSVPFFLYVGRLAPEKNVVGLLRAWMHYRAGGGTWNVVFAGDGPERNALETLLRDHPEAEAVTITGLRSAAQLTPLWAIAACFVLPSTREPWGLVVNEAMAAGLPVLVSCRCGAAADLVHEGENGFTFDPSDLDALSGLLHRMQGLSSDERRGMGLRSAERIRALSPQSFGDEVANLLCELGA